MMWVYAVILAASSACATALLARAAGHLPEWVGLKPEASHVLTFAALSALLFLVVAQVSASVLCAALLLLFAGIRHAYQPIPLLARVTLLTVLVFIGFSALPVPQAPVTVLIPKLAVMALLFVCWSALLWLPMGAASRLQCGAFALSFVLTGAGALMVGASAAIAADALVIIAALAAAAFVMREAGDHPAHSGGLLFLYLVGYLAVLMTYQGFWWLAVLGLAPLMIFSLARRI